MREALSELMCLCLILLPLSNDIPTILELRHEPPSIYILPLWTQIQQCL